MTITLPTPVRAPGVHASACLPPSHRPKRPPTRRAAAATEYIAILALVVIPLALLIDMTVLWAGNGSASSATSQQKNQKTMIPAYEHRITSTIALPVG